MMVSNAENNDHFWEDLDFNKSDLDFFFNFLLEREVPLSSLELVNEFIPFHIEKELDKLKRENAMKGESYMPSKDYLTGDKVVFPSADMKQGTVISKRNGFNPDLQLFNVIEVIFENKERKYFACSLEDHLLNQSLEAEFTNPKFDSEFVKTNFGSTLEQKLEKALSDNHDLVRIAGYWFPKALLVDINAGHLNLAEAVLEEAHGGPLDTITLMEQVELSADVNQELLQFSFDHALQEDIRFDEVGPSGKMLWFLQAMEPDDVRKMPVYLNFQSSFEITDTVKEYLQSFEGNLYDELDYWETADNSHEEAKISLIFPHLRSGTLPLSNTLVKMFPTAYEAPRVRFTFIDEEDGTNFPGWVVRKSKYVYGLKDWYEKKQLIPGNFVSVRKGKKEGEINIRIEKSRQNKEWLKTILVGTDRGIVFAMLKHPVNASFNERMAIAIPDISAVDDLWNGHFFAKEPVDKTIFKIMRELSKLNPQGQVHAQELYSAVNIVRRCPPSIIMNFLVNNAKVLHLGDLYFRILDGEN